MCGITILLLYVNKHCSPMPFGM